MSCHLCFKGRSKKTKRPEGHLAISPKSHHLSQSMVSAFEGERNSITSFVSFDVDERDDRLSGLEAHGRLSVTLLQSIALDKTCFRDNGKADEVSLWFCPKSVAGMPMITLGEISMSGSIPLQLIITRIMDLSRKTDWDPEFLTAKEISSAELDDNTRLRTCWSATKPKPGVAGRDFVYHAFTVAGSDSWTVASWSADIDEVPPDFAPKIPSPGHVRARLFLGGFFVQRSPTGDWLVSYVNQVEIGISSYLSDPVLKRNPGLLNNLKSVLEKECIVSDS